MKEASYALVSALLASVTYANNGNDKNDEPSVPNSMEQPVIEEPTIEGEETGLLPVNYSTFKSDHLEVTWGGRIFFDVGWFSGDSSYVDDSGGIAQDGAEFRTVRFSANGRLYDTLDFKIDVEAEGDDENNLKDIYLGFDTPIGDLLVGYFKEPFSMEELTSSRFITFMERGLPNVFVPARNMGFQFSNYHEDLNNLQWAVGAFRNSVDGGLSQGDGEYSVTGRVTGTILDSDEGQSVLHAGLGYSLRSDIGGMIDFTEEPEIHMLADLGGATIPADDAHIGNLELAWVEGPVSFQGEYFMTSVNAPSGGMDADYMGYYVLGSYFLTGESRAYQASRGRFNRVKPMENFDGSGGSGAWELAARFSMNDFNDGPTTNETTNYTVGLNWYLNPHTRIMANYIHSEFEDVGIDDSLDAFMLRFQVDF